MVAGFGNCIGGGCDKRSMFGLVDEKWAQAHLCLAKRWGTTIAPAAHGGKSGGIVIQTLSGQNIRTRE
jgi:hypothetical protein